MFRTLANSFPAHTGHVFFGCFLFLFFLSFVLFLPITKLWLWFNCPWEWAGHVHNWGALIQRYSNKEKNVEFCEILNWNKATVCQMMWFTQFPCIAFQPTLMWLFGGIFYGRCPPPNSWFIIDIVWRQWGQLTVGLIFFFVPFLWGLLAVVVLVPFLDQLGEL